MEIKRLFDILDNLGKTSEKQDILNAKENKKWVYHSVKDFERSAKMVAHSLLSLGLQKGDTAAIMSANRPEWVFADFGIQQAGLISVPIFPTISTDDLK